MINPPEAIQNLVTPVATPQSVRPGFCNSSGHATVCQTSFSSNTFCTRMSRAIPHSHRPVRLVIFYASGHTTVCQTGFFYILDLDINGHTTVSQTGFFNASGHTTVCQTGFFYILDLDVNDHTTHRPSP